MSKKYKKHGYAERLKYMHMLENGYSAKYIQKHYGINELLLSQLWAKYQYEGSSGLIKKKNIKADYAFKVKVVRDIEENHLTLAEASLKYNVSHDIHLNHKTVQKLMVEMSLYGKRKKAKYKSYKGEIGKIAPNVIDRDFVATAPNQKWTTDVTEVKIKDRKIYLSPILDMFNGEIISYTVSYHPDLKMALNMLNKAFKKTDVPKGLILHSDQGWHYQHLRYQKALKEKEIVQSMSRKGNCLDNAMMENFFGLMKSELLYLQEWDSVEQFAKELVKYIHYYNNDRIKLRLKGQSPVKYRALFESKSAS